MSTPTLELLPHPDAFDAQAHDRRKFIGGSDMAAILGRSPYATPYQLWVEKTAEEPPPPPDAKRQRLFDRGKILEPYVIEIARREHQLDIVARNQRFFDPVDPFLSCEIDFEHRDGGAIENADVKTVHFSRRHEWGEPGTDEIPTNYTIQFLFGQMVTQRESTLCMGWFSIDEMQPYRVRRDEDLLAYMRDKAREFWELVETRTPPPLTTLEDAKIAFPRDLVPKVEATAEIAQMVERLRLLNTAIAGDEAKASLLELDIKRFMGPATELVDAQGRKIAAWKTQAKKSYTVAASECRVFRT